MRILPYYHLTTLHLLISLGQGMVQAVAFKFQLMQCNEPLIRGNGRLERRVCAPRRGAPENVLGMVKGEDTALRAAHLSMHLLRQTLSAGANGNVERFFSTTQPGGHPFKHGTRLRPRSVMAQHTASLMACLLARVVDDTSKLHMYTNGKRQ